MGDRGQVFIEDEGVYLYTHWGASELLQDVAKALARGKDRWNDPEYLARIIFCEMMRGDYSGTEGYGIGKDKHGDIWRLVRVSCSTETVTIEEDREGGFNHSMQFSAFVQKFSGAENND